MRVSVNLKSQTIERLVGQMKFAHLGLLGECDEYFVEATSVVGGVRLCQLNARGSVA